MTTESLCMGCKDGGCSFVPMRMMRRALAEQDVLIDVKFCGVCHSDLYYAAGHLSGILGPPSYPMVPGHEVVGVCAAIGSGVTSFKVGDILGVGCMVDSCLDCAECKAGREHKCKKGCVMTYDGKDKFGRAASPSSDRTLGGYSDKMVVHDRFLIKIPTTYPIAMAGPVMCSGVTMYEPLKVHKAGAGTRVGVVGLGGLGVMGLKLAKALGCTVIAISRGEAKRKFALEQCGADSYVASTDAEQCAKAKGSLDLILNTIPFDHDPGVYTKMLAKKGKHVLLGLNDAAIAAMAASQLTFGRCSESMSAIGSIAATQELIELCDKHKIYPEIEKRPVDDINRIFEKLEGSNDAGVRYVLDIEASLTKETFERPLAVPTKLALTPEQSSISTFGIVKRLFKHALWA